MKSEEEIRELLAETEKEASLCTKAMNATKNTQTLLELNREWNKFMSIRMLLKWILDEKL